MDETVVKQIILKMLNLRYDWTSYTPANIEAKKLAFLELREVLTAVINQNKAYYEIIQGALLSIDMQNSHKQLIFILGDHTCQKMTKQ